MCRVLEPLVHCVARRCTLTALYSLFPAAASAVTHDATGWRHTGEQRWVFLQPVRCGVCDDVRHQHAAAVVVRKARIHHVRRLRQPELAAAHWEVGALVSSCVAGDAGVSGVDVHVLCVFVLGSEELDFVDEWVLKIQLSIGTVFVLGFLGS